MKEGEEEVGDIADPYDLFDPVPKSLMRPMNTDRPGFTESPHTLDAGHFQFEVSLFDYSKIKAAGVTTTNSVIGTVNIKAGLNLDTDAHVVIQSYKIVKVGATENKGFGDIIARLKFNLFGNDRGSLSGALLPFIKIPTNSNVGNNMFEGGLYFPTQWKIGSGWSFDLMIGPEFMKNAANNKFHFEFIAASSLAKEFGKFVPFLQFNGRNNTEFGLWIPELGGGLIYALTENLRFDGSVAFGLNANANDVSTSFGLSLRI